MKVFLILFVFLFELNGSTDTQLKSVQKLQSKEEMERLHYHYFFYREGYKLDKFCQYDPLNFHSTHMEEHFFLQAFLSTLQYMGLDKTTKAISEYALLLNFTPEEYGNLVDYLVGGFCSGNLSVIGIRELKKKMIYHFNHPESFKLPHPGFLFPQSLQTISKEGREREFLYTVSLFQSYCSWGGNTKDLRLMVPLAKNPALIAFIIRRMTMTFSPSKNPLAEKRETPLNTWCDQLICRRQNPEEFYKKSRKMFPGNIKAMFSHLYCKKLKEQKYQVNNQIPRIKKIIDKRELNEDILMVSQMNSLATGIPDFFLHIKNLDEGKNVLLSGIDEYWDQWTRHKLKGMRILFEERPTIELLNRRFYFQKHMPKFKVVFDINRGEFDRMLQGVGKLMGLFHIELNYSFVKWIREQWFLLDHSDEKKKDILMEKMAKRIEDQVAKGVKKFNIPIPKNMNLLIVKELLSQLGLYQGDYFEKKGGSTVKIPIQFNYSLFALKYQYHRHRISR